jgi:RNA polymerase sigma-70 factor (sigma-E family)
VNSDAEQDFTAFVESRSHVLLRAAYALCGDQHSAEDLLQSTLAKTASNWTRIRGEPEHYVRAVLYREFVSGWRRRRRRAETIVAQVPDRQLRADQADATTDRIALRALLQSLPPRQRAVIVLRYLEDMSVDQVAEVLGCSRGTVGSQTTRALIHLRRAGHLLRDDAPDTPAPRTPTSGGTHPSPLATREVTP